MKRLLSLIIATVFIGLNGWAETDEEMIQRVGLDPRAFSQGQLDPGKLPGLRMWLKGDVGITNDADGRVSAWSDAARGAGVTQVSPQRQPDRRLLDRPQLGLGSASAFHRDRRFTDQQTLKPRRSQP